MAETTAPVFFLLLLLLLSGHHYSAASPIKTVVVLVMENRSFDHMLGWMKKLNPEINGVDGSESNRINTTDPNSSRVFFGDKSHFVDPDPGHSFQAIREQIFGSNDTSASPPPMNGFAQQAFSMDPNMTHSVMNGFHPDKYLIVGSPPCPPPLSPTASTSIPAPPTAPPPMWPRFSPRATPTHHLRGSRRRRNILQNILPEYSGDPLLQKPKKAQVHNKIPTVRPVFQERRQNGKLPGYAVVEQRYMDTKLEPATDDHPSHDVYQGQLFVKEVYETLRASPQWNETLLVITYDEHGGFYDHVATPNKGVPSPDGIVGPDPFFFKFDRLGVRVPTIVVSPWVKKGTAFFDSATVRKIFNLKSPPLTKREEWAGTFDGILQILTQPRTDCPACSSFERGGYLDKFPPNDREEYDCEEGKEYMENAIKSFLEAGLAAVKMGVDPEQIVKMIPSLSTRS
ncbi:hypothetical protein DH2020_024504 [Rehmannia glutinosa]|uniref:Uncharacterized protein n=1 Tax=Rehmannia glutinosa TaxID=99300 RepID=A0ABR0W4S7_REHGL